MIYNFLFHSVYLVLLSEYTGSQYYLPRSVRKSWLLIADLLNAWTALMCPWINFVQWLFFSSISPWLCSYMWSLYDLYGGTFGCQFSFSCLCKVFKMASNEFPLEYNTVIWNVAYSLSSTLFLAWLCRNVHLMLGISVLLVIDCSAISLWVACCNMKPD